MDEKKRRFREKQKALEEKQTVEKLLLLASDLKRELVDIDYTEEEKLNQRRMVYCAENGIDPLEDEMIKAQGNAGKKKKKREEIKKERDAAAKEKIEKKKKKKLRKT